MRKLTESEQAEQDETDRIINAYFEDIHNNICPTHKKPITQKQVGRCVYAEPCGCRLYQGTIPSK